MSKIRRDVQQQALYGGAMVAEVPAATQIVVDAWVLLVAAAGIVISVLGTGLSITFHLAGRIDHQSDEIGHVRERVARLEVLFANRGDSSGPATEPPAADE